MSVIVHGTENEVDNVRVRVSLCSRILYAQMTTYFSARLFDMIYLLNRKMYARFLVWTRNQKVDAAAIWLYCIYIQTVSTVSLHFNASI